MSNLSLNIYNPTRQSKHANNSLAISSRLHKIYDLIPYNSDHAFNEFSSIYNQAIHEKCNITAFSAWTGLANTCFYSLNRYDKLYKWVQKIDKLLKTAQLPDSEKVRNPFIAAYFNAILFCHPNKHNLSKWHTYARHALDQCDIPEVRSLLVNHLLLANIWQGEMHSARLLYSEFLGDTSLQENNPLTYMMQKTMHGQISWLNCDKKECLKHVKEGLNYSKNNHINTWDAQLTSQAAYSCIADKDFKKAGQYLKQVEVMKNPHHLLDNAQYHFLKG